MKKLYVYDIDWDIDDEYDDNSDIFQLKLSSTIFHRKNSKTYPDGLTATLPMSYQIVMVS